MKKFNEYLKGILLLTLLGLGTGVMGQESNSFDWSKYEKNHMIAGEIISCGSGFDLAKEFHTGCSAGCKHEKNDLQQSVFSLDQSKNMHSDIAKKSITTGKTITMTFVDGHDYMGLTYTAFDDHFETVENILNGYTQTFHNSPTFQDLSVDCAFKFEFGNIIKFPDIPENLFTEANLYTFANSTPGASPNPLNTALRDAQAAVDPNNENIHVNVMFLPFDQFPTDGGNAIILCESDKEDHYRIILKAFAADNNNISDNAIKAYANTLAHELYHAIFLLNHQDNGMGVPNSQNTVCSQSTGFADFTVTNTGSIDAGSVMTAPGGFMNVEKYITLFGTAVAESNLVTARDRSDLLELYSENCNVVENVFFVDNDEDQFIIDGAASILDTASFLPGYVLQSLIKPGNDCDDTNAGINPDADEVCDGVDNNCDGNIDEDGLNTFVVDVDGDGFVVDGAATRQDCASSLPGYVLQSLIKPGSDCDDTNAGINPDADEVCDGVDNNCDNEVDEDLLNVFFVDADEDQFIAEGASFIEDCGTFLTGYILESNIKPGDDCDDNNPNINPDADDPGGDGVDSNCDGIDGSVSTGQTLLENSISISPNPTFGLAQGIIINNGYDVQYIKIYDITGKELETLNDSSKETLINISEFPQGVYIVKIQFEALSISKRIVKH